MAISRTEDQERALKDVVMDKEGLEKAWNNPAQSKIPCIGSNRMALVTLIVASDVEGLKWSTSVRIYNQKKRKVKAYIAWTPLERSAAMNILLLKLTGVGRQETDYSFTSSNAVHLNRLLTEEELDYILSLKDKTE